MREKRVYAGAVFFSVVAVSLLMVPGAWARDDLSFGGVPATVPVSYEDASVPGTWNPGTLEVSVYGSPPNDLELGINVTCPNLAYLELLLVNTDAVTSALIIPTGSLSGTTLSGTVFDDKATVSVTESVAPYTGHLRPVNPLGPMVSGGGTYKLVIRNFDRDNEMQVTSAVASYLYWPDDLPQRGASVFSASDTPQEYYVHFDDCSDRNAETRIYVPPFAVRSMAVRLTINEHLVSTDPEHTTSPLNFSRISLRHVPTNITVVLKEWHTPEYSPGPSVGGRSMINTVFSDLGDGYLDTGTEPYTGIYRPWNPLSAFNADTAHGEWVLRVEPYSDFMCDDVYGVLDNVELIFNDLSVQYNCSLAVPWFVDNSGVAQGVPPQALGVTSIITLHNNRSDILPCAIEYYTQAGTYVGPFENNTFTVNPNASVGFRPGFDDPDVNSGGAAGGQEDTAARMIPDRPSGTENGNDNKKNGSIVIRWSGAPTDLQGAIKQVAHTSMGVMSDSYALPPGAVAE